MADADVRTPPDENWTPSPEDRACGTFACRCGCGAEVAVSAFDARGQRFATPACRARRWREGHTRRVSPVGEGPRARARRAHVGREFQLEQRHVDALERFATRRRSADLSDALRTLIEESPW